MGGGGAGPAFGPAPFLLGGVGAAKGLLPCFLVPKRNQPTACTLALWWLKFGPTEDTGGGYRGGGGEPFGVTLGVFVKNLVADLNHGTGCSTGTMDDKWKAQYVCATVYGSALRGTGGRCPLFTVYGDRRLHVATLESCGRLCTSGLVFFWGFR